MSFRCIYYNMNLNDIGEHKNQPVNQLDSLVESRIQWIREGKNGTCIIILTQLNSQVYNDDMRRLCMFARLAFVATSC